MPGTLPGGRHGTLLFWRVPLCALVALALAAQPGVSIEPTDRTVALSGVLRMVYGYGPPGWGENKKEDIRISYWVIDVPQIIRVQCPQYLLDQRDHLCNGTKRLRLIVLSDDLRAVAASLKGKQVIANGFLRLQKSAQDMTPVYMEVVDLKPGSNATRTRP